MRNTASNWVPVGFNFIHYHLLGLANVICTLYCVKINTKKVIKKLLMHLNYIMVFKARLDGAVLGLMVGNPACDRGFGT